ncbi:nuclear transport factor 2 family protein [Azoarcus sp. KH32C]|uniref:nuclear transport factor 2 family protein n=1 Tax=Azoarcus sp. KH32C TaxID=748247 RepID=UPI000349EA26|nr:nuclear transport factor 2 family protein [Azoarcus sp. KH32C]
MKMRPNSALALTALVLALGSNPSAHAADTLSQVQSLVNQGQHSQALAMADRLLAANAKDPQTRFLKGIALTELNRPDEAISVFQKLTEDFPELPEPYNNLAVLYAQQRQYDKARAALEMAIRTHPSYATAHENLGDVYARLASQAYDKALQLDSANAAAQSKLALIREITSGKGQSAPRAPAATAASRPVATASAAPAPTPQPAPAPAAAPAATPAAPAIASTAPTASPAPAATNNHAAAPAPAAHAASATSTAEHDAIQAVEAWAKAWSRKDVKAYLGFYDKDFRPPGGQSRRAWENEREQRVAKPGKIAVEIEKPKATVDGDVAVVRFRQNYDSVGFNASSNKTIELVKRNGTWRIREERVGG